MASRWLNAIAGAGQGLARVCTNCTCRDKAPSDHTRKYGCSRCGCMKLKAVKNL